MYSRCKPCAFSPVSLTNSTERDVILVSTTARPARLEILVRSLRTAGCRARIVAIMPIGNELPVNIEDCGVEAFLISSPSVKMQKSPHKIRWEWMHVYLEQHFAEFDRVMHTDAFDAFTQGDPFTSQISRDRLYVIGEGLSIRSSGFNSRWMKECRGEQSVEELGNKEVLCSGTLLGGTAHFRELVRTMVTDPNWDSCWSKAKDQPEFNYHIYKDIISRIPVTILSCLSGYLTMGECSSMQMSFFDLHGHIRSPLFMGNPIYIHQYNRYSVVDKHIQQLCGLNISRKEEKQNSSLDTSKGRIGIESQDTLFPSSLFPILTQHY